MDLSLEQIGKDSLNAIVKPISDKLNAQIDKLALQSRSKLAFDRGVAPAQVTDLEVAEYLSNMPTQKITDVVADKMVYIGQSARNGLIIGLGLIAIAIMMVGLSNKKKI